MGSPLFVLSFLILLSFSSGRMGSGFARELDIGHVCFLSHFNMLSLIIVSVLIDLFHLPLFSHSSSTSVSLLSLLFLYIYIFLDVDVHRSDIC